MKYIRNRIIIHGGRQLLFNLSEVFVRPILPSEEQRYNHLMQEHHYLGALPKISETLWYVAVHGEQGVALLKFFRPGHEMCIKGSVDRMGPSSSVRPTEADYQ